MHPLWLNRVQPGTFGGEQTRQNAHPLASLLDRLIVAAQPGANHLTLVPEGVVPDQDENRDRLRCQMIATYVQKIDGDRADGTAIHKAQEHLVGMLGTAAQQHAITRQGFGIRVLAARVRVLAAE